MTATLKLLTLNTWGLPGSPDYHQRMDNIARELRHSDYDLIGLQEVWRESALTPLLTGAAEAGIKHSFYFRSGGFGSGLAILSRYPIRETHFMPFAPMGKLERLDRGRLDALARKGIGMARVQTPQGMVDVYNLHPIAQYEPDETDDFLPHRSAQVFTAGRAVALQSTRYPVIAFGDYNLQPHQHAYRLFRALTGAVDVYAAVHADDFGATFSPESAYISSNHAPQRIDYIFVRGGADYGVRPLSAELAFRSTQRGGMQSYADHFGIAASVELDPAAAGIPQVSGEEYERALEELDGILHRGIADANERQDRYLVQALLGFSALGLTRYAGRLIRYLNFAYSVANLGLAFGSVREEIHWLQSVRDHADVLRRR